MYMMMRMGLFAGIAYCAWDLPLPQYFGIFGLIAVVELVTIVKNA